MPFAFAPEPTHRWTPRGNPFPPPPQPDCAQTSTSPNWPQLQAILMRALAPYPEARAEVSKALLSYPSESYPSQPPQTPSRPQQPPTAPKYPGAPYV